jgi:hypothetical protein
MVESQIPFDVVGKLHGISWLTTVGHGEVGTELLDLVLIVLRPQN